MKMLCGLVVFFLSFSLSAQDFGPNDSFSMFVISDTQYPWACTNGSPVKCEDEGMATMDAIHQVMWVLQKAEKLGPEKVAGVIINGDLTAFGHKKELESFSKLWVKPFMQAGLPLYLGLGNHDYENNVNDCYNNNCATRMYEYMRDYLLTNPYHFSYDYQPSKVYYKFPKNHQDHKGSLSYSWNIGKIHFVQLHNHPDYTTEWSSWNLGRAVKEHFIIEESFEWLKKDLEKATKEGKKIIINLHDHGAALTKKFQDILGAYKVSAVFGGHLHSTVGKVQTVSNQGHETPIFLSGSSAYQSALVLHFKEGKTMEIEAYRGKQKNPKFPPPYEASTEIYRETL